ncbi:MAG: hypothetical protein ACYCYI_05480 [Saccharofermentanales bacterium]
MSRFSGLFKMIFIVLIISALIFLTVFCNKQIEDNPYSSPSKNAQANSSPLLYVQADSLYYKLKGMQAIKIADDFSSEVFIAPGNSRLAYFRNEIRIIENSFYKKIIKVRSLYFYDIVKAKETKVTDNCVIENDMQYGVEFGYKGFLFYTAFDPEARNIDIYIFNGTVSMPLIKNADNFALSADYRKMFYTSYKPKKSIYFYEILSRKNHLIDEDVNNVLAGDEIDFDYFLYDKKTGDAITAYLWSNGIRKAVTYDSSYTREYFNYRSYIYNTGESDAKTYEYHIVEKNRDTVLAENVMDHTFDPITGNLLYVTKSGYYYKPLHKTPVLLAKFSMRDPATEIPAGGLAAKEMEFSTDDWKTFYCLDFSGKGLKDASDLYSFQLSGGKSMNKTLIDENAADVMTFSGLNGAIYYKNAGTGDRELFLITNHADGTFDKKTGLGRFAESYQIRYINDRLYILMSQTDTKTPGDLLVFDNGGVNTILKSVSDMFVRNDVLYAAKKEGASYSIYEIDAAIDAAAVKIAENVQSVPGVISPIS